MGAKLLLVDDDPSLRRLMALRLQGAGYKVSTAASAEEGLVLAARETPDLVISDLRMDGMDGRALQQRLSGSHPGLPVILITAHGTIPDAVEATLAGAFAFLTKPVEPGELLSRVELALRQSFRRSDDDCWRDAVLGSSNAMCKLLERTRRVAPGRANVLITGPSGSGKEALARALHAASGRSGKFVAINCAAIPAPLLESELFGHRRGAFTGAINHSDGLMWQAHDGTLLLDEVGDMPMELQTKLLRVIEDREVRAVGAREARRVDLRMVAATHQDLNAARRCGRFRDDLYYRLRVVHLEVPPLCDRAEDVPALVRHKLASLSADFDVPGPHFSPGAMALLMDAPWPGNVRQLFNVVEHCVTLSSSRIVSERVVRDALAEWSEDRNSKPDTAAVPPLSEARDAFMQSYLSRVLSLAGGNVSEAARLARRNRTDFYKLLQRHHVDRERFKT